MQIESARAAAKRLNEVCGTKIKINFVKSEDIEREVASEIDNGLENVPEDVMEYYNSISRTSEEAEPENEPAVEEAEKAPPRWSMEKLTELANDAGFEIEEGLSENQIADSLLDFVDGLDEDAWMRLPKPVKDWNVEAIAIEQEESAIDKTKKELKKEADEKPRDGNKLIDRLESAIKEKKKKPSRKRILGRPERPGFQFNKGTSGRQVMDFFNSVVDDRGITLKEFISRCLDEKNIKSANVVARVRSTIGYAMLGEGGRQVIKYRGLLYKGHSPIDDEGKGE